MPSWGRLAGLAVLALWSVQGPDLSKNALVNAAADYVRDYQQRLTYLVADEVYVQRLGALINGVPAPTQTRTMRSEVFFLFVPGANEWMAVRDVKEIDGLPPPDRRNVQALLVGDKLYDTAKTIKDFNSRYNLGRVIRNFNEPTLSLLVLDRRYRAHFSFEKKKTESLGGALVVTMAFSEDDGPTLIRNLDGRSAKSKGELQIEAGTGRIRRAELRTKIGSIEARLETTYALDDRLGLWLPSAFTEYYYESETRQTVNTAAAYTSFRKFGVETRIK